MARVCVSLVTAVCAAAASLVLTAGIGQTDGAPLPTPTDVPSAQINGLTGSADTSPPGSNRRDCHDPLGRPPVILVHGTASNQRSAWTFLAPALANAGYCVHSLTYGQTAWSGSAGGLGDDAASARLLADFVIDVRRQTGSRTVDLVTHSKGASIAEAATRLPGVAGQVSTIVNISGTIRGYDFSRPPGAGATPPNFPNIRYTNIGTTHDEIVFPLRNESMDPATNVTNIVVQQVCPSSTVGHLGIVYSPTTLALVRNALDPTRRVPVPCGADTPY